MTSVSSHSKHAENRINPTDWWCSKIHVVLKTTHMHVSLNVGVGMIAFCIIPLNGNVVCSFLGFSYLLQCPFYYDEADDCDNSYTYSRLTLNGYPVARALYNFDSARPVSACRTYAVGMLIEYTGTCTLLQDDPVFDKNHPDVALQWTVHI